MFQANTALGLGVSIQPDGGCKAAGGFYVQVLPLVSDETVEHLERNISSLPAMTTMMNEGVSAAEITGISGSLNLRISQPHRLA